MPQSSPPATSPHLAVLTPIGRGAVATIAVWGTGADKLVEAFFHAANRQPLAQQTHGRIIFGSFGSPTAGTTAEELVICRRAEDELEIHCHGGLAAAAAIANLLISSGGNLVTPEDYLAVHSEDEIEVERDVALTKARTEFAATELWQGAAALRRELAEIQTACEQGDRSAARRRLSRLAESWSWGKHLTRPFQLVLCGVPNVGKSSLLNALVGYERAIVFDQPGTTRDVLAATLVIDGWLFQISDTAGLRSSDDELEQAGMSLAQQEIMTADLLLVVVDARQPESPLTLPAEVPQLFVANKCDLAQGIDLPANAHLTSAFTGAGIDELRQAIKRQLLPVAFGNEAILFTERQRQLVSQWQAELQQEN